MKVAVGAPARSGAWTTQPGFGVYLHVPFCRHRCHYCDFNTYEGMETLREPYVEALVREIERTEGEFPSATSVFVGGGTPTLLPPVSLGRLLDAVRARVGIEPGAEVTVEANPETVDEEYFGHLLEHGVNRVSIGIQSLVTHVLTGLGRTHSPEAGLEAVAAARRAGVPEVSGDLIFGSPWESDSDWRRSLDGLITEGPDHISAYALTVEEGTPLATLVATGRVRDVDPDVQAARYEAAADMLAAAGYERYEVSNWARPGRASRHNVLYWCGGDYLGFGAGAHEHISGRRSWRLRLPRDYIAAVAEERTTEAGHEVVRGDRRAAETMLCGLRLASGIEVDPFERAFPGWLSSRFATVTELEARGLVEWRGGWLRLTPRGTLLGDDVVARLA